MGAPAVRSASTGDAGAIAEIYGAAVRGSVATFELEPPGATVIAERMLAASPRLPWYVAVDAAGTVLGYAYAGPWRTRAAYRWSVETTVYVRSGVQRSGVGRALYAVLVPELRALGYVRAYAGIALPNDASVALHEAFGFTPCGVMRSVGHKHGRWIDVGTWELALADPPPEPAPPRPWLPG